MTFSLRRLLASSTFAIAGTLKGLADKLEKAAEAQKPVIEPPQEVAETFESFEELEDEWEEERSEEHTSELQSPDHLVCRLLLEKKKTPLTSECTIYTHFIP